MFLSRESKAIEVNEISQLPRRPTGKRGPSLESAFARFPEQS